MRNPCMRAHVQVPMVYVVPVESILGKLSLVRVGDTGTIPFEPTATSQDDIDELSEQFYPGGIPDTSPGSGDGSKLWHTNPWTIGWSRDM